MPPTQLAPGVLERIDQSVVGLQIAIPGGSEDVPGVVVEQGMVAAHGRAAAVAIEARTTGAIGIDHPLGLWTGALLHMSEKWWSCGVAAEALPLTPVEVRLSRTVEIGEPLAVAHRHRGRLRVTATEVLDASPARGGAEGLRPYEAGACLAATVEGSVPRGALVFDSLGRLAGFVDGVLLAPGGALVTVLPGEWLSAMGPLHFLSLLAKAGELEQLVAEFAARFRYTRDPRVCCLAAETFLALGRGEEAVVALRKARELQQDNAWVREMLETTRP